MSNMLEELEAKNLREAEEMIAAGFIEIVNGDDGRPCVYRAYSKEGIGGGWGGRFGPFKDNEEAEAFIAAGSFVAHYRAGHGSLKVGHRVRYVGKGPGAVEDVAIGTLATVTKDNGFDSRYWFQFDKPTAFHIWSRYPGGEFQDREGMRTGGHGWQRAFDEEDK